MGLEHPLILVSVRILEPIPHGYQGVTLSSLKGQQNALKYEVEKELGALREPLVIWCEYNLEPVIETGIHNCLDLIAQLIKESPCNAGDPSLTPGLGRSPGEGIGYQLQYSGLENSMDCVVHGVAKSRT